MLLLIQYKLFLSLLKLTLEYLDDFKRLLKLTGELIDLVLAGLQFVEKVWRDGWLLGLLCRLFLVEVVVVQLKKILIAGICCSLSFEFFSHMDEFVVELSNQCLFLL
jgi:hypothetical protein